MEEQQKVGKKRWGILHNNFSRGENPRFFNQKGYWFTSLGKKKLHNDALASTKVSSYKTVNSGKNLKNIICRVIARDGLCKGQGQGLYKKAYTSIAGNIKRMFRILKYNKFLN